MKNEKQTIKILKKITNIAANLLLIYTFFFLLFIFFDLKDKPENYFFIDNTEGIPIDFKTDSWEYRASNIQDCKPAINIINKAKWFNPILWGSFLIIGINFILNNYERLKTFIDKLEKQNKED